MRILLAILLAASAAGGAAADDLLLDEPHVPGQLVVQWMQPSLPPTPVTLLSAPPGRTSPGFDQAVAGVLGPLGLRPVALLRKGRVWLVGSQPPLPDAELERAARTLVASTLVDAVAANSLVYFEQSTSSPNDPDFPSQWALQPDRVDAPGAWAITKGSRDVLVAILDTGVDVDHPDLAANVWLNACEDLDHSGSIEQADMDGADTPCEGEADGNGMPDDFHGWNFVMGNGDVADLVPHGSHVAGIVGAVLDNGVGVSGLAGRVSLAVLKVGDTFIGDATRVAAGLDYALEIGVDVVNASFTTVNHYLVESAVQNAGNAGVLVVAAAGVGQYAGADLAIYPTYPAAYPFDNVVAVTSTTQADGLDPFANYGAKVVELGAPGVSIRSTLAGGYFVRSGTSMAAPHVAGVAALIRAIRPGATVQELRACLKQGDAVAALAGKTEWGVRLDARKAVEACAPQPPLGQPGRPWLVDP